MDTHFSELQLDALRELANIGSGNAASALSAFIGRAVDVSVPEALALPLADAVEAIGDPASLVTGVALPVVGDLDAIVLLLMSPECGVSLCEMLGVDSESEIGRSALAEAGNILASSYVGALSAMTGIDLQPCPPEAVTDMLGAIAASVLAAHGHATDVALLLDSELGIDGEECSFAVVLVPSAEGVGKLLASLGLSG